ncbi:hypothetical protein B0T17DRAFT_508167 [Bombardia bombarda]|uniref:Uncharacterized protein n=1 Tax=Bombardia bombarda TaxID=252184 RepID=A0AA39X0T8_9PEZI|nr:hypothetical protein B0T17DRAFT_508167 [Bombardia bombarda]
MAAHIEAEDLECYAKDFPYGDISDMLSSSPSSNTPKSGPLPCTIARPIHEQCRNPPEPSLSLSKSDYVDHESDISTHRITRPSQSVSAIGQQVCFLCLIIVVEALVVISVKNQGLATSHLNLHYLWTYGPTAILTIIGALWSRVEFQAKLVAPWRSISNAKSPASVEKAAHIDYLDMWFPEALLNACRSRDGLLVSSIVVGLLLVVARVLSTSLITLDPVYVTHGTSEDFVFQKFSYDDSILHEVTAIVDGISPDIQCQDAQLVEFSHQQEDLKEMFWKMHYPGDKPNFNISISADGCDLSLAEFDELMAVPYLAVFGRYWMGYCGNDSTRSENLRIGFVLLRLEEDYTFSMVELKKPNVSQSIQFICYPTASALSLEVVSRAKSIEKLAISAESAPKTIDNFTAASLMNGLQSRPPSRFQFPSEICVAVFPEYCDKDVAIYLDIRMLLALMLYSSPVTRVTSLFSSSLLQHVTKKFCKQVAIQIINYRFTEPKIERIIGTEAATVNRVRVRPLIGHTIASLSAASVLLLLCIVMIRSKPEAFQGAPSTILGFAMILVMMHRRCGRTSTHLSNLGIDTRSMGSRGHGHTADSIANMKAKAPIVLRSPTRIAIILTTTAIISVLEILLRKSKRENGLSDIQLNSLPHYIWTLGPTISLVLLAVYHSSVDFAVRSRQPFVNMCTNTGSAFSSTIGLNLVDRSIGTIFKTEVKIDSLAPFWTTLASLVTSLFTIFSASLFITQSVYEQFPGHLEVKDSFHAFLPGNHSTKFWGSPTSSLTMQKNITFPVFTYQDLVFPELSLGSFSSMPLLLKEASSLGFNITVTLPALRPRMTCILDNVTEQTRVYFEDLITVVVARPTNPCIDTWMRCENYTGKHFDSIMLAQGAPIFSDINALLVAIDGVVHQPAVDANKVLKTTMKPNTTWWEQFWTHERQMESVESDMYDTLNFGARLYNNFTNVWNSTAENTTTQLWANDFFSFVMKSQFSIPISTLVDLAQVEAVTDAIRFHHGIIRAQSLHAEYRTALGTKGAINLGRDYQLANSSKSHLDANETQPILLNATFTQSSRRMIQDEASTRILQALLGATIVFSATGWLLPFKFNGKKGISPLFVGSPTNIAETMYYYERFFEGHKFRLGWIPLEDFSKELYLPTTKWPDEARKGYQPDAVTQGADWHSIGNSQTCTKRTRHRKCICG